MGKLLLQFFLSISIFFITFVHTSYAQEKQVLSVTPPLFQISSLPGDVWQSSVKVVNSNPYPLTVYAEVVNFEPVGEGGQGAFSPRSKEGDPKLTLADWIVMKDGPIVIPPEQTIDVPFFAELPQDAPPGGHYAAIMISTDEPKGNGEIAVLTSQAVTSLVFLRVEGDVIEKGDIREFSVVDSFLDKPDASFLLRFENKGNVHLHPQGNIVISNMWGTEQGNIPINYQSQYGNVLPKSIRNFNFAWKSDFKITDVGRYKAVATISYGVNGIKSVSAVSYFWVIPVKWTLITVGVTAFFIWLIVLMVKAYVRRMLELAGVPVQNKSDLSTKSITEDEVLPKTQRLYAKPTVAAPIKDGVLDLRKQLTHVEETKDVFVTLFIFVKKYKIFFTSIIALIAIFITVTLYIGKATEKGNEYEVTITEGGTTKTLTDEDVTKILPK